MNGQRHQMNGLSELIEQGINFAQRFVQGINANIPQPPQERQEEKKEEKVEPKVEPKVEAKPEPSIQQKMPRKTEEKKVEVVEAKIIEVPKIEEPVIQRDTEQTEKKEVSNEHTIVEGANYLSELMNMSFTKAYKLACKYPMHSKEQLLELYLSQLN